MGKGNGGLFMKDKNLGVLSFEMFLFNGGGRLWRFSFVNLRSRGFLRDVEFLRNRNF
jgi:hypothetical protein